MRSSSNGFSSFVTSSSSEACEAHPTTGSSPAHFFALSLSITPAEGVTVVETNIAQPPSKATMIDKVEDAREKVIILLLRVLNFNDSELF